MTVVDANVALAWALPSARSEAALALLARPGAIRAPDLIVHEATNALWLLLRQGVLDSEDAARALEDCLAPIDTLAAGADLSARALAIAGEIGHPAYDCFYLACAETTGERLITADQRLIRAVAGTPYSDLVRPLV